MRSKRWGNKNQMKKILAISGALALAVLAAPAFMAFEAHVVNVTATIENALGVSTNAIDFGTVFPQEYLAQDLTVRLSQSFLDEPRVDDVEYFIRQKPKCGVTTDNGTVLVGMTTTGHVIPNGNGGYTIDCGPDPRELDETTTDPTDDRLPVGSSFGVLPSLCEYISKDGELKDQDSAGGVDGVLASFHKPFTVSGNDITWTDVRGRLAKSIDDFSDTWVIDLSVPCFGGYCAQDWAQFVADHDGDNNANPAEYTQPIDNEHKVFGCDLWVEVSEVSEAGVETGPTD